MAAAEIATPPEVETDAADRVRVRVPLPTGLSVAETLAFIRARVRRLGASQPAGTGTVPHETASQVFAPSHQHNVAETPHRRGAGVDWSDEERDLLIDLRNAGVKVPLIMAHLPGRTDKAIRMKLTRLGLALQARRGGKRLRRRRKGPAEKTGKAGGHG
jgi:hypothetical protein